MNNRPRIQRLKDMDNEATVAVYDKNMRMLPHGMIAKSIFKTVRPEGRMLDIACGPARLLAALAKTAPGLEIHGLDIADNMMALARDNLKKAGIEDIHLWQASVFEMPFTDNSFDIITSTNLIHMVDDIGSMFSEIIRILKPGGTALIYGFRRDINALIYRLGHLHSFYLRIMRIPLEGMGFVFDASYTADEVRAVLDDFADIEHGIKMTLFNLVITIRKSDSRSYLSMV